MISLTLEEANTFVDNAVDKGIDVRWEGWTMVFHQPLLRAMWSRDGRFSRRTRQWGYETQVEPNADGIYLVNYKLARGNTIARR